MGISLRALIVEDSENDCALLVRTLSKGGYEVHYQRVDSPAELLENLESEKWDIVISDHSMPGFSGTAALSIVREKGLDIPFIFLSGTIGEELAVNAMKVGAQDYIMKGNLNRLIPAIQRELREALNRKEHRNAELRMRQLEKFEIIGKLAGGIAHDFNNVIGAIMGWAELGSGEVPAGSRAANFFQQIRNHSERAAGLTRQLLAYARRQILEPRNISLNQVIGETISLLQKVVGEQIEITMRLAPDLQATRADPAQIEQVLMNLCVNARDAMPNGGNLLIETSNVEIDADDCRRHVYGRPGKYVRLSVSDTGIGINAATMERIFEPFFTTKDVGKGTGLGLATSLGIIKQHEGSIDVSSEIGKGTTFHVYLPVHSGAVETEQKDDDAPVIGGSETILIADDHSGVREMNRETLETLGYRVILARDGEEAIKKFEANLDEIALVLMDMVMPKLHGRDLYARIMATKPGVHVILTSGYVEDETSLIPMISKNAIFLQKPYGPKTLARQVRALLSR